ncbi:alpha-hydroxy acid oxidase [Chloroflexota bacterium]
MKRVINIEDARERAYKQLPKFIFDFLDGGAEDEVTLHDNRRSFSTIKFNPRVLVDVSERDMSTTILGEPVKLPLMLAPAGGARLLCRDGEIAAARAAGHEGTIFSLSTASNFNIEEVSEAAPGPLWFQLYSLGSREDTASLVERAQKAGYKALCVCVDFTAPGKRERDLRNRASLPPQLTWNKALHILRRPLWLRHYLFGPPISLGNLEGLSSYRGLSRKEVLMSHKKKVPTSTALRWEDLKWIREMWTGPLVIKGIMNADDAKRVLDYGVNGIVVSNHGGRQLDGSPSSIEVLPEVVASVAGHAEVFIDSGIRRGTDVVKAIALGAQACLIGRPYLFGLAIGGETGVIQVLKILRDEIDRTMALIGCRKLADLNHTAIRLRQAGY